VTGAAARALPRVAALALALGAMAACAPRIQPLGTAHGPPQLASTAMVTPDGWRIPIQTWLPRGRPKAVIIGLHGMNDYANGFEIPAERWRKLGIATIAYDQRGFGRTRYRGIWPGVKRLERDFATMVRLVHRRYPRTPVYAVGVSMGGGVVLSAMGKPNAPKVDGIVLVAPAVWSRASMPFLYRAALTLAAHTIPGVELSPQGLDRLPTDNIALLRKLSKDPHMIHGARVDAIFGVANLMDAAAAAAPHLRVPTLLLYGERDEIIPRRPVRWVIEALPSKHTRIAVYPDGWHMLLRDTHAQVVQDDIAAWIRAPGRPLPSGADRRDALKVLSRERPPRPVKLRRRAR
jgi:acylglycerol lipase